MAWLDHEIRRPFVRRDYTWGRLRYTTWEHTDDGEFSLSDDRGPRLVRARGTQRRVKPVGYLDRVREVKLRVQWLDDEGKRLRAALQPDPDEPWTFEEISDQEFLRYMNLAGVKDVREWSELGLRARAARREWGHEGGFAEWTPRLGSRKFTGDLLRTVED